MKSFLIRLSLFLLFSFIFLFLYSRLCDYLFTTVEYANKAAKREWIFMKNGEKYDYVILGSSRAEGALDIKLVDSITQRKGVNLGVGGAGFADNYLILDKFIKSNKLKTVYLQVDLYSFDSDKGFTNSFSIPNYLPFWNEPVVNEVLRDFNQKNDNVLWTYVPFTRYMKYNKYYNPFELLRRLRKIDAYQTDKFDFSSGTKSPEEKVFNMDVFNTNYKVSQNFDIKKKDLKYLNKIIELCKINNIELITFRAPEFYKIKDLQVNRATTMSHIYNLLKNKNLPVLDNNNSIEIDHRNFVDATHLSVKGQNLFTYNFIQLITQKND
ncbi:hypothetical protein SAMN04488101_10346 [Pedobacter nyackensis]|uniref:DUF1574 domain-containing protein n=2 Tax=Pedobacter nyackensis TaxID=475255 RepID=A0A1W2C1F3_9SPHI|nr:hypothetical protein SAMN04488101_10346 [Pedobacter nyackensis]